MRLPVSQIAVERLVSVVVRTRWRVVVIALVCTAALGEEPDSASSNSPSEPKPLQSDAQAEAIPVREREVTLNARGMPFREALAEICRQVDVSLELDEEALMAAGLDPGEAVNTSLEDEAFEGAMARLIQLSNKGRFTGAFWELDADRLVVSTLAEKQEQIKESLPDWLRPLYNHGLLAEVDELGNVVSVTASGVVTDELLAQLATLPRLSELHVETTKGVTAAGLAHLGEMGALEKLSLYEVNVEGNGLGDAAIPSIAHLKWLRDLSISECGATDAGARHLESMPQLTRLTLKDGRLTDAALTSVGELTGLTYLDLSTYGGSAAYGRMQFSRDGIRQLAALQELEELHLTGHAVPAEALVFDRLTSLSLGGAAVDDACAARIAACRHLKSLSLSYTGITDEGMKQIATIPALTRLELDSHLVTDFGVAHLKDLQKLRHLSLRASQITDASLAHLAGIKSLTRLDLHGSGYPGPVPGECFTVAGLQRLKALPKLRTLWLTNFASPAGYLGLKELTQLRVLSMQMCDIQPQQATALQESLPNTTIHAASGGGALIR